MQINYRYFVSVAICQSEVKFLIEMHLIVKTSKSSKNGESVGKSKNRIDFRTWIKYFQAALNWYYHGVY